PDRPRFVPNDPMYPQQWHLDAINSPEAWMHTRGRGAVIAVIDTGVAYKDFEHRGVIAKAVPDLAGVEMVSGKSFVANGLPDGLDDHAHGTHVAGTIAQATDNGVGVAGVAHQAAIMPLKVLAANGGGSVADISNAIRYAADNGADVINMSLGTTQLYDGDCDDVDAYSRALAAAFGRLRAAGAVAVAASGNDGSSSKLASPACIASVVSVGAIDDADRSVADFTNRGPNLDLLAPGVAIVSDGLRGGVDTKSGTSMASPHVAGAFALLMAEAPWASPDLLEQVLKENGQRPTVRLGGNEAVTIKVDAALTALLRLVPTATLEPPSPTPAPPTATSAPATATPTAAPASPT
ncbi:MAG: S8 family serine peptidase, partial [Myxococcales bacterium]|nr:S8 family serine peptidase [Myxococcales bacterium]